MASSSRRRHLSLEDIHLCKAPEALLQLFDRLENARGIQQFNEPAYLHAFTQRLLGRVMFLYFSYRQCCRPPRLQLRGRGDRGLDVR